MSLANNKQSKEPCIFVIGNEKGGAGKTTCAMHLVASLLYLGHKVGTIDADVRQQSLTRYINNRQSYNDSNPDAMVQMPLHRAIDQIEIDNISKRNEAESGYFVENLQNLIKQSVDYIVIDTPGSHTNLSCIAHSYADTVITPMNDSMVDLDVIAKISNDDLDNAKPSIYSQMLWEQKMSRAARDGRSITWVVVRNRLSNIDAINKRNVSNALEKLSKRIAFKIAPGFSERVIFRELFLCGLTLLDLKEANYKKTLSLSHVAARQELRDFAQFLGITPSSQNT